MKYIKIFGAIIASILLLIVAASFILPSIVDMNQYRSLIEEKAAKATGREVKIEGDISLSILPTLHVKTGRVSIGNPVGFDKGESDQGENGQASPFFQLESTHIGIEVFPLIQKNVKIKTIELNGMMAHLYNNAQGENNWTFKPNNNSPENNPTETSSDDKSITDFIDNLEVKKIVINNAELKYEDKITETNKQINRLNLSIADFAFKQESPINLSFELIDNISNETIAVETKSHLTVDLDLQSSQLMKTSIAINLAQDVAINTTIETLDFKLSDSSALIGQIHSSIKASEALADLSIESIQFDGSDILELNELKLTASQQDSQFNASTANVTLPLSTQIIDIETLSFEGNFVDEQSLQLSIPGQSIDLNNDVISISDINGSVSQQNIPNTNQIQLDKVNFNKASQSFSLDNFMFTADNFIDVNTNITGNLYPLMVTLNGDVKSSNLSKLVSAFHEDNSLNDNSTMNLSINAIFDGDKQQFELANLSGNLAETSISASGFASLGDGENGVKPAYKANVIVGKLNLDQWLAKAKSSDETQASSVENSENDTEVKQGPLALASPELNALIENTSLDIKLSVEALKSDANQLMLKQADIRATSETDANRIDLSGRATVNHNSSPQPYDISLQSTAQFNDNSLEFVDNIVDANNHDENFSVSIPSVAITNDNATITIDDIKADIKQLNNTLTVDFGNVAYDQDKRTVMIKSVQSNGKVANNNITLNLPFGQLSLAENQLLMNDLTLDIDAKEPVGRVSIPSLNVNLETLSLGKTTISFEGKDGQLQFNLEPSDNTHIKGQLITNRLNLKGLLSRFNAYPFDSGSTALTNISINNAINIKDNVLTIPNLQASFDKSKITGSLTANLNNTPSYKTNLQIDTIDIRDYVTKSNPSKSTSNKKQSKATPIPYDAVKGLNLKARIKVNGLTSLTGSLFSNVDLTLNAENNHLSLSPLKSNYAGGSILINAKIDANQESVELNADLSKLNVGETLSSLAITEKFSGKGSFGVRLKGQGKTSDHLLKTLNGKANIDIKDGDIRGIDLQEVLFNGFKAFNALKSRETDVKYEPNKNTKFGALTGSWNIQNGTLKGQDLKLTAPAFDVSGTGNINLPSNNINYQLNIAVVKSFEGQGRSTKGLEGQVLPLKIVGDLNSPSFRLDLSTLLQNQLNNQLKEQKDKIQNKLLDKLGQQLNQGSSNKSNNNGTNEPQPSQSFEEQLKEKAKKEIGEKLFNIFN